MKVKKLGRPKRFKEDVHRLHLILPKSVMSELLRIAQSRPDRFNGYINHVILEALTQYIKKN